MTERLGATIQERIHRPARRAKRNKRLKYGLINIVMLIAAGWLGAWTERYLDLGHWALDNLAVMASVLGALALGIVIYVLGCVVACWAKYAFGGD